MKKKIDLASGNIFRTLFTLSLPILGTSFIQMAYSMVDMIWIGRVGSAAVAAIGTAGFLIQKAELSENFLHPLKSSKHSGLKTTETAQMPGKSFV